MMYINPWSIFSVFWISIFFSIPCAKFALKFVISLGSIIFWYYLYISFCRSPHIRLIVHPMIPSLILSSVPQTGDLLIASFRFHVTMTPFHYANHYYCFHGSGFTPYRLDPCRAHKKTHPFIDG